MYVVTLRGTPIYGGCWFFPWLNHGLIVLSHPESGMVKCFQATWWISRNSLIKMKNGWPETVEFFPISHPAAAAASQPKKKKKNNIKRTTTTTTDKINRERLAMRIPSNREQIVMSLLSTSIHLLSPTAALFSLYPSLFFFFARLK